MKVCFVAAPLTARSGVYRSAREIVEQARAQGLEWSLYLAIAGTARGERPVDDPDWIVEESMEPAGLSGVFGLARRLRNQPTIKDADMVVSLIPQADMALSLTRLKWVAFLRGLPWPGVGESGRMKTVAWKSIERLALLRSREIWATTTVLARQVRSVGRVRLVPAGIRPLKRAWDGVESRQQVVWAARFDRDKDPELFLRVLDGSECNGVMYGSGGMRAEIERAAPSNVEVRGWADSAQLWEGALAYVGTSSREAFGRSAVEAAMKGIPVVLSDVFGVADLLYTDPELAGRFVLDRENLDGWKTALRDLSQDPALRARTSDHVWGNANKLTIAGSVGRISAALDELATA